MVRRTFSEAIWDAIREEMRQDARVLVLGQDVELNPGLKQEFGQRVRNTPISEAAFVGAGIGAALTGLRPIVELGCCTFLYSAMDQVINQAAKNRYMFGGQASVPLLIRAPILAGVAAAAHHADRPWGMFAQAPGLKIIVPSTAYDAKGLIKSAIRDANPVICFEEMTLGGKADNIPEEDYCIPIGLADIKRAGDDLTIVAVGTSVDYSLQAAEVLEGDGVSAEVIDLRSVVPLDRATILRSVTKTGRLVVVDAAPGTCSVAAEVAALAAEQAFEFLQGPVIRLTAPDIPIPYSPTLEQLVYPTVETIVSAVRQQVGAKRRVANAVGGRVRRPAV